MKPKIEKIGQVVTIDGNVWVSNWILNSVEPFTESYSVDELRAIYDLEKMRPGPVGILDWFMYAHEKSHKKYLQKNIG